jgi:hypothetical protein
VVLRLEILVDIPCLAEKISIEVYNCTHMDTKDEPPYHAWIRVASWVRPFLNVALRSINGLTGYQCNDISSKPHVTPHAESM